jgi:solute carrier family 13 (sodium-dependent dicarboxylate transporter), member 2/3/5
MLLGEKCKFAVFGIAFSILEKPFSDWGVYTLHRRFNYIKNSVGGTVVSITGSEEIQDWKKSAINGSKFNSRTSDKDHTAKRIISVIIAIAIIVFFELLPSTESLSHEGAVSIGVLLACVVMWFCGTMPQGVTGLVGIVLLVFLGVTPELSDALSGFTSGTTWFILCVFCMTAIMQKTSLGLRLTAALVSWAGANSRKLVFAFMCGTAIASFFMTDTGAVVLGMSMSLPLLKAIGAKPGKSNLGKCLMLGSAFSGVLGGFSMPCGHSLNILGIGIMESTVNETVSFLSWMCVGIPIVIVMLPITWFLLTKAFPPESLEDKKDIVLSQSKDCGKWEGRDKKALFIVALLPVLWIASNWISALNTTLVAMIGLALMFFPGMDLMRWKDFQDIAGWNVFLFFGSVMCLGNAVSNSGGTDFIANLFLNSGVLNIHPFFVLLIVGFLLYIIHTLCPVAPALCMLFLPPLLIWAQEAGIPTLVPVFVMASITAGSFLVPLNPTIAVTYDQGFYKFGEVAKGGWLAAIIFVTITVCWSYLICVCFGLIQSVPLG